MLRVLRVLMRKEFLQIRRDPVILRMLVVMPIIQLVVLANAATFEVTASALWVVDADRTPAARALVERFTGSGRSRNAGQLAVAGTLEQLNVTPVRPSIFIAAKLLPLWLIALVEFGLGLLIAVFGFGVPLEGSVLLLFLGAAVFLVGALGVGLWISTIAETQQQALFVTFSLMMVYILMSGLFTPVRAMPDWVRVAAQVNPLLHFIAMVRAVMLRGAGLRDVAPQLLALSGIGAGILALAVSQYRKRAG